MSHVKTVLAAVLVSVMALSAPVGVQAKTKLTLGTASMGGNYFNMGAAIAKVFNDKATGYTLTAQATGGSAFNLTAIEDKELDFGISQGPAVMSAIAAQTVPSLRTVANYNGTPQHVLVRTDAGIKSLKDLKGKRIELIAAGDGVEVCSRKVVESIGLNWDDVKHEYSGNRVQASSRLKTGQVDAIIDGTGVGDVGSVVLRDRKHLAQDGMLVVVVNISSEDGSVISGPDIITRGFVYVKESENLMEELRVIAAHAIDRCSQNGRSDWSVLKANIKNDLSGYLFKTTKRNPMILPVIMEI